MSSAQKLGWIIKDIHPTSGESLDTIKFTLTSSSTICMQCRGTKMLCGRSRCPILTKVKWLLPNLPELQKDHVDGSSPPGAFVGHVNYPKVYVGPLIPPEKGDTGILDTPELWLGKDIDTIIEYRFRLIRGKTLMDIHSAADPSSYLLDLHDLALSSSSVDVEARFQQKPRLSITVGESTQPFGPSATLRDVRISAGRGERRLESVYYDGDMLASDAILKLYRDNVQVSRIQRILSLGMLGVQRQRKMVPTRWSITAVDDTISKDILKSLRRYPTVDKFLVYKFRYLDNVYSAIMAPRNWEFEWIEAWFPGTAWNQDGVVPALMGDYEPYQGRGNYASVGGCYYSSRLAVAEALERMQRQASVLVLREIRPGYIVPVGVWGVRESVRATLKTKPYIFNTFKEALAFACEDLAIQPALWAKSSMIIRKEIEQQRLSEYFS